MFKIIIGFAAMILFTIVGKFYADKLNDRAKTLADFCDFNARVTEAVTYFKDDICTVAEKTDYKSELGTILKKSDNLRKNVVENKAADKVFKSLDGKQSEFISGYLDRIGRGSKDSEAEYLGSVKEKAALWSKESAERAKKLYPLYLKIGFLVGLVLFIILL